MYDFIYDQQDVYDYYTDIFEERENSKSLNPGKIEVRQPALPFAAALERFDDVLNEFIDEKNRIALGNLRWYTFTFTSPHESDNKMMIDDSAINNHDDFNSLFPSTVESLLPEYQIKGGCTSQSQSYILSILNSLFLTFTFFCKHSYYNIMKYKSNYTLFLDTYIKRV